MYGDESFLDLIAESVKFKTCILFQLFYIEHFKDPHVNKAI